MRTKFAFYPSQIAINNTLINIFMPNLFMSFKSKANPLFPNQKSPKPKPWHKRQRHRWFAYSSINCVEPAKAYQMFKYGQLVDFKVKGDEPNRFVFAAKYSKLAPGSSIEDDFTQTSIAGIIGNRTAAKYLLFETPLQCEGQIIGTNAKRKFRSFWDTLFNELDAWANFHFILGKRMSIYSFGGPKELENRWGNTGSAPLRGIKKVLKWIEHMHHNFMGLLGATIMYFPIIVPTLLMSIGEALKISSNLSYEVDPNLDLEPRVLD